jgi:flagellar hook-associated protein 2
MMMPAFTSLGVGSGLDLEGLVTGLMNIERLPISSLEKQKTSYNTKISALGTLNSKLASLQTAAKALKPDTLQPALDKFASFTASLGDEKIGSVTASVGAVAGSYKLKVDQLAQGQKLTLNHALPDTLNAGGTLTITLGSVDGGVFKPNAGDGNQKTITLTDTNNTPAGLRDAINKANIGVSATLVQGDGGSRLVLTGKDGANQAFSLAASGLGAGGLNYNPANPPGSSNFTAAQEAKDAKFTLDGIEVTRHSNTISDALSGITLTLAQTGETTLNVKQDNATKLKSALEAFVKAYNDASSSMKTMGAYDAETKVAGSLQGNRILRDAQNTLSKLVFGEPNDAMKLADIGITFNNSNGTLSIDNAKLTAAIAKDPEAVANFVGGSGNKFDNTFVPGLGDRFSDGIEKIVGFSGSIKASTDSLKTSVRDLEKRQDALELRLESVEARYRKQFTALDTLMSKMNSTSNYLTQQLAGLSKMISTPKS